VTSKVRTTAGRLATLERYELLFKIGTGGVATVYLGRRRGPEGFSRLVAVKRAHPHLQGEPSERRARVREASVASRLHHANVVAIQDVEVCEQDLVLVMDYIEGASLSDLLEVSAAAPQPVPLGIVMRIALDVCAGLRAVHDLTDERGRALSAVHRDISPQNILVGIDGLARVSDFGLAKLTEAASHTTGTWRTDSMAGKLAYLAPELVQAEDYDARCDIFSLGVVLWEAMASRRLFGQSTDPTTAERIVKDAAPDLSRVDARVPAELARVIARALEKKPTDRWGDARSFAEALQDVADHSLPAAPHADVGAWVEHTAAEALATRRELIGQCTDDVGDRPSVDFAFEGTASMVADGFMLMADDAPTPHRAERALDGAVTEGSVTEILPVEEELTESERDTINPSEVIATLGSHASSASSPVEALSLTSRRWRIGGAVAAAASGLVLGLIWYSSASPVSSGTRGRQAPESPATGAPDAMSPGPTRPVAAASAHVGPLAVPSDESASSSAPAEEDVREGAPPAAVAARDDPSPRDKGDSDDASEGDVTIDLDELEELEEPSLPERAAPPEPPRAATPKPPANPYRR